MKKLKPNKIKNPSIETNVFLSPGQSLTIMLTDYHCGGSKPEITISNEFLYIKSVTKNSQGDYLIEISPISFLEEYFTVGCLFLGTITIVIEDIAVRGTDDISYINCYTSKMHNSLHLPYNIQVINPSKLDRVNIEPHQTLDIGIFNDIMKVSMESIDSSDVQKLHLLNSSIGSSQLAEYQKAVLPTPILGKFNSSKSIYEHKFCFCLRKESLELTKSLQDATYKSSIIKFYDADFNVINELLVKIKVRAKHRYLLNSIKKYYFRNNKTNTFEKDQKPLFKQIKMNVLSSNLESGCNTRIVDIENKISYYNLVDKFDSNQNNEQDIYETY